MRTELAVLGESSPRPRTAAETCCFNQYVSYAEEPELVPALRIYLSGCNFRCRFCNVAPGCFVPDRGERIVPTALARECEAALADGVRTINLLGGEPSLVAEMILQVAAAATTALPLVLNTNGYFDAATRESLRPVIQTWLVDLKFGNDRCAAHLAGVENYLGVVTSNVAALAPSGRLLLRHLLMPGHFACCFQTVVRWLSENLPGARFHLMTGYVPAWRAIHDDTLGRLLTPDEVRDAHAVLEDTSLLWSSDSNHGRS